MAASASGATAAPTSYRHTIHRKVEGTLTLTSASLTFQPKKAGVNGNGSSAAGAGAAAVVVPWTDVAKHQVSPATHPKFLLKLVIGGGGGRNGNNAAAAVDGKKTKGLTFALNSRSELERIRRDITGRLRAAAAASAAGKGKGKKRSLDEVSTSASGGAANGSSSTAAAATAAASSPPSSAPFTDLDPDALAVTRSSLLSSDPTLRAQHALLVSETQTLSEDDFWATHGRTVADEYARIHGRVKAGQSSAIRSNLDLGPRGRVKLGVEEMRQIFVMYPAVHRAYEEKVPLELSEEQFWRKYLESEFFHRDRGRIGAHVGRVNRAELREKERMDGTASSSGAGGGEAGGGGGGGGKDDGNKDLDDKNDEAAARVAAAGSNDMFSRLDSELRQQSAASSKSRKLGTALAVGQFDLAATAGTERGDRVLGAVDLHPQGGDDTTASRVIDKYNRHWAMVLNPDDATAGCDLVTVARRSVEHALEGDDDAKANGGIDREMDQLVSFASAAEEDADHVHCVGDGDDGEGLFAELALRNVGAYSGQILGGGGKGGAATFDAVKEEARRIGVFSKAVTSSARAMATPVLLEREGRGPRMTKFDHAFPPAALGRELLSALTKKMVQDSQTEADAAKVASGLPEDFRKKLNSYFRRTSELLRHFFGLRDVIESGGGGCGSSGDDAQKLARIVKGMENVYREMEGMRKDLPQTESGEIMRKMCLPIMEQLDCAFKLHRDGAGGGGGFVTVEEL